MLTEQYSRLNPNSITILRDERQRRNLDLERGGLLESIRRRGVLNPIIVRQDGEGVVLVAGERRLMCSRTLNLPSVPVRFVDDLPPVELQIIELEENLHREDLVWQDLVRSVSRIHELYRELNPAQLQSQTAESIGLTEGIVSMYLVVAEAFTDPAIGEAIVAAGTVREAYNFLLRRKKREQGNMLNDLLGVDDEEKTSMGALISTPTPTSTVPTIDLYVKSSDEPRPSSTPNILCADFLHWAPRYSGPKFNFIHIDFPYGIGVFGTHDGQRSGEGRSQLGHDGLNIPYDDSEDTYRALVSCLVMNFNRLMSSSGHLMFWFSNKWEIESWTRSAFGEIPGLRFARFPLIWHKSDNAGVAAIPTQEPRHVYECALMATRGGRDIVKLVADCYSAPTARRDGESIKPTNVLKHFFTMFVDEHTRMLDPTCGSGSAIVAAETLGAQSTLGLEVDPGRAEAAAKYVAEERTKRRLALMIGG